MTRAPKEAEAARESSEEEQVPCFEADPVGLLENYKIMNDGELTERDAGETVEVYMLDPTDAGKQKEAVEVLENPEFVAVRAEAKSNAAPAKGKERIIPALAPKCVKRKLPVALPA